MRFWVVLTLFASAVLFLLGYRKFLMLEVAYAEAFYRFISFARRNIECYMAPLAKNNSPFVSPLLEGVGFLPLVRAGRSPKDAYRVVMGRLVLSREARIITDELFLSPSGYHSHEVRSYELAERRIFTEIERERVCNDEKIKVVASLVLALAVGIALVTL